jgi:hypothetical protein
MPSKSRGTNRTQIEQRAYIIGPYGLLGIFGSVPSASKVRVSKSLIKKTTMLFVEVGCWWVWHIIVLLHVFIVTHNLITSKYNWNNLFCVAKKKKFLVAKKFGEF